MNLTRKIGIWTLTVAVGASVMGFARLAHASFPGKNGMKRGTLAGLGLLLAVGLVASPAGAARPCGRQSCKRAIAAQCAGLTGKAKGECKKGIGATCEAGTSSCTGDAPCSPADAANTVDTSKTLCCLPSNNKCVVKT